MLRQLKPVDRPEVEQFLLTSPVENLFLIGVIEEHGLIPGFYGMREEGSYRGVLLVAGGRSAVPFVPEPESFTDWDDMAVAVGGGGRLVGAAGAVGPLWQALRRRLGGPSPILDRRQLLYKLEPAALQQGERTTLRTADLADLDAVVLAHSRMIAEDEGYDPLAIAPTRFRRAVAGRIERKHVYLLEKAGDLLFKVDLSADCRHGVQFAGVYTVPSLRRRGIARACLADLAGRMLADRPFVTLHVDSRNAAAVRTYESVGFRAAMDFRMVVLGY